MASLQEIDGSREGSLRDYVGAFRRQKTIFFTALLLVPVVAFIFAVSQSPSYQADAEVLITNLSTSSDADRVAQTEVSVARVPAVALHALNAANVRGRTADDLLAQSTVTARSNADILDFSVKDRDSAVATRLVNAYASQFTLYQGNLNTEPLVRTIGEIRAKLAKLGNDQASNDALIISLRTKETQLETEEQVQNSNVRVLQTATTAGRSSPRPALYLVLGLILGLVLGSALALVADALDARVRSVPEALEALGSPLLGLVQRRPDAAALVGSEEDDQHARAVRALKTKLVTSSLVRPAQTIMFTSASTDDGQLEVVANLALSLARGQRRVSLVDFDLGDPSLAEVFGVNAPYGLTDVIAGRALLEEALVRVKVAGDRPAPTGARRVPRSTAQPRQGAARPQAAGARSPAARAGKASPADKGGRAGRGGQLLVLTSGLNPSKDEDLVDAEIVPALFEELRATSDLVVINAPPLLEASDTAALTAMVDAIVMVAGIQQTTRSDLLAARLLLGTLSTPLLGVVLTEPAKDTPALERVQNLVRAWLVSGTDSRRRSTPPSPVRRPRSSD